MTIKWTCTLCDTSVECNDVRVFQAIDESHVCDTKAVAAKVKRLTDELEPFQMLTHQACPKKEHADWFVDSEHNHLCPWCRIAELETEVEPLDRWADIHATVTKHRDSAMTDNELTDAIWAHIAGGAR